MKTISIIMFSILLSQATSYAKARFAGKKDKVQWFKDDKTFS